MNRAGVIEAGTGSAPGARFLADFDPTLLSQVEDAGLNASAPPQQRWLDGWLVRLCPGKAQRARCINAVAAGRRPVTEKLEECAALYRREGLPLIVRITPFTQPAELDASLAGLGLATHDDTRVMVRAGLPPQACVPPQRPSMLPLPTLPNGVEWVSLDVASFADAVGAIRGTPRAGRVAHAERLASLPVPCERFAIRHADDPRQMLACGQYALEGKLVGLYDIATAETSRGQGLGTLLCERLLVLAAANGARTAYLQVGADNDSARRIYRRLGFADAYSYHYRIAAD